MVFVLCRHSNYGMIQKHFGVTRQSIIKIWLVERLELQQANKANPSDS